MVRRLLSKKGVSGFFCLLVGVGALWWLLVPKEPSYQGKTLTEWQEEAVEDVDQYVNVRDLSTTVEKYEVPFRTMGTNSLPILLTQLKVRDSSFKDWLIRQCQKREWSKRLLLSEDDQWLAATISLMALKDHAAPIVPELIKLAETGDGETKLKMIRTCGLMGVDSQEFLKVLLRSLRIGSEHEKQQVVWCLRRLGLRAKSVLPELEMIKADAIASGRKIDAERVAYAIGVITEDYQYPWRKTK